MGLADIPFCHNLNSNLVDGFIKEFKIAFQTQQRTLLFGFILFSAFFIQQFFGIHIFFDFTKYKTIYSSGGLGLIFFILNLGLYAGFGGDYLQVLQVPGHLPLVLPVALLLL
jgi:hypothetical protein